MKRKGGSSMVAACLLVMMLLAECAMKIKNEHLMEVITYLDTLHKTKKFTTIQSLFDVAEGAGVDQVKKKHNFLMKKLYVKKGDVSRGSPLGKEIDRDTARLLIVNGYKILSNPHLREAYEWLRNEAPIGFIESMKRKEAPLANIMRVPLLAIIGVLVFAFVLFDISTTYVPYFTRKTATARLTKKELQKMKKKGMKREASPRLADTMLGKAISGACSKVAKVAPASTLKAGGKRSKE